MSKAIDARPQCSMRDISITITQYQAEILRSVLHRVGGTPRGPRGFMDTINEALKDAGVELSEEIEQGTEAGSRGWVRL